MLFRRSKYFHRLYIAAIVIKGIDGVLELIGGLLLLFISTQKLSQLCVMLTQHELTKDPDDKLANFILTTALHLPSGTKMFGAVYLLAHGIFKIFLAYNLLKERMWIFPVALGVLSLFVGFQGYRLSNHFSYLLFVLTFFDCVVMWFIYNDYTLLKEKNAKKAKMNAA